MSEEKTLTITNLQKDLLIKHLNDMNIRLGLITGEISYLMANIKAVKMLFGEKYKGFDL